MGLSLSDFVHHSSRPRGLSQAPFFFEPGCSIEEGFPGSSVVKNPPAVQEMQIRSLDQEDALEKEMAIHSVFLPGKSHGQWSLVGYSPWDLKSQT